MQKKQAKNNKKQQGNIYNSLFKINWDRFMISKSNSLAKKNKNSRYLSFEKDLIWHFGCFATDLDGFSPTNLKTKVLGELKSLDFLKVCFGAYRISCKIHKFWHLFFSAVHIFFLNFIAFWSFPLFRIIGTVIILN